MQSIRLGDFDVYCDTLALMAEKIAAHDHYTYKRILCVHLRDLNTLKELHPTLYVEFKEYGHFVAQKSKHPFSKIALDHAQEQLIDTLKNSGSLGSDLLNVDPATLRRQLIIDNKITQIISQFEDESGTSGNKHHEQYPKFQKNMKVSSCVAFTF